MQLYELRQFASQRGFEIVDEYTDHGISGTKARRPALDRLLKDAYRHRFDVVLVWSCDRLARSTKHFLQVLDELNDLGIQFLSQREAIDTDGPLGRAIVVIVSAVAELERSLIVERVRAEAIHSTAEYLRSTLRKPPPDGAPCARADCRASADATAEDPIINTKIHLDTEVIADRDVTRIAIYETVLPGEGSPWNDRIWTLQKIGEVAIPTQTPISEVR
jgi:DNA invertase Pin-like site-specific DNA recombinase